MAQEVNVQAFWVNYYYNYKLERINITLCCSINPLLSIHQSEIREDLLHISLMMFITHSQMWPIAEVQNIRHVSS